MTPEQHGHPKAHVLLVEDDPAVRQGVREYLVASGFDVSEADSCAAAHVLFQTVRVDIAIMDYHLPDGNAIHLVTTFKGLDRDVPIIVLTGHGLVRNCSAPAWMVRTASSIEP